jgi:hypothetical protein
MGSPFASLTVSDPIPLPFDSEHWIKVRKLTGREIDAAQEGHRTEFVSGRINSWSAMFRRALQQGASDPQVLKAIADPLTGFDRFSLVRSGLVEWSYPQTLAAPAKPNGAVSERQKSIDDLDDEAVDFIAREVLRLTKPGLFHATVEDATADRGEAQAVPSGA